MRWNSKETIFFATKTRGEKSPQLEGSIQSINDRLIYVRYHFKNSSEILKSLISGDEFAVAKLVLSIDLNEHHNYLEAKYHYDAHVLAALQSLHALSDTFAHVIYYSLGLDLDSNLAIKDERQINLSSVCRVIGKNQRFSTILELMDKLRNHNDYHYLCALTNHAKHRSVISSFLIGGPGLEDRLGGIKFIDFKYNGLLYEGRFSDTFIEAEYDRQNKLIVEAGCEIMSTLQLTK